MKAGQASTRKKTLCPAKRLRTGKQSAQTMLQTTLPLIEGVSLRLCNKGIICCVAMRKLLVGTLPKKAAKV